MPALSAPIRTTGFRPSRIPSTCCPPGCTTSVGFAKPGPQRVEPGLHALDENGTRGVTVTLVVHETGEGRSQPQDILGLDLRPVVQQDQPVNQFIRAEQGLGAAA